MAAPAGPQGSLLHWPQDIVVRDFRPGGPDDAACKDLEAKATMMPKTMRWIVDGHFVHKHAFDRKVSQFPGGIILVAVSAGEIVGMVCGALKEVRLHWEGEGERPVMAVYVFDLRVAGSCQRCGLGAKLVKELEVRAAERGVKYAYLTVNDNNTKAQQLFRKLGFSECSVRCPVGAPLAARPASREPRPPGVHVARTEGEVAASLLAAELGRRDLLPADLQAMAASPFFLGTFVAWEAAAGSLDEALAASGSLAAVSLWDGAALTSFRLTRFFFPAAWYSSGAFQAALALLAAGATGLWCWHLYGLYAAGYAKWALCEGLLTALAAAGALQVRPVLRLVFALLMHQDREVKMRARLFAPLRRGPRGAELLAAAVSEAKAAAQDLDFMSWICNLDRDSPLRDAFGAPTNFSTYFMHKALDGSKAPLPRLEQPDFHDPRDI